MRAFAFGGIAKANTALDRAARRWGGVAGILYGARWSVKLAGKGFRPDATKR